MYCFFCIFPAELQTASLTVQILGSIIDSRERGLSDVTGALTRGLYGLVTVGIAAYFYPLAQHLAEERHPAASASQIDEFIRGAGEELRARLGDEDPELGTAEQEPAWRVYLRHKETSRATDGRRGRQGTLLAVEKVLDMLAEHQLVRRLSEGREDVAARYQPLERFRLQVAAFAGDELFEALSRSRLASRRPRREEP